MAATGIHGGSSSGGTVIIDDGGGSITVDGPLTDTELRATPVEVEVIGPVTVEEPVDVNILSPIDVHNTSSSTSSFVQVGGWDQFQNIAKILPIRSEFDPIQKADSDPGVLVRNLNPVFATGNTFTANGTLAANMLRHNAATVYISVIDNGAFSGSFTVLLQDAASNSSQTFAFNVLTGERVTSLVVGNSYFVTVAGVTNVVVSLTNYAGGSARVNIATSPEPSGMLSAHLVNSTLAVTQSGTWDEVGINDSGNSITVDAANLDIRELVFASDKVDASGSVVDTELPAAAALTDNTANPTVPAVAAFGMVYDGATWDRAPGNSADGALVNLGANNDVTVTAQATNFGKTLTRVPVAQGAAGTTVLAAASPGNRHKIVGCVLTMSAAGTLKFLDGSGDLTGAMDIVASGGFVLPTSLMAYQETAVNSALSITTTTGLAKGVVSILTEA